MANYKSKTNISIMALRKINSLIDWKMPLSDKDNVQLILVKSKMLIAVREYGECAFVQIPHNCHICI